MTPYYRPYIKQEEIAAARVLRSGDLAQGKEVAAFEERYSRHCGGDHCIMVSSATAAIYLACKYYKNHGLQEIDVPAYTFCATYQAALAAGLKINIRDVNNEYSIINRKSKNIIPVMFAGKINCIYEYPGYSQQILVDAAHCFPFKSSYDRIYSFYPTKPIACGTEGGMLVTPNKDLADWARRMRQHGRDKAIGHEENPASIGFNFKASELAAAVAREQLKRIDFLKAERERIANRYASAFSKSGIDCYYGDHLFILRFKEYWDTEQVELIFKQKRMGYSRPYIPLADETQCPNAWVLYRRSISVPYYPGMTNKQIDTVINAVRKAI